VLVSLSSSPMTSMVRPRDRWTDAIIDGGAIGSIVYVDGEVECAGFANLETRDRMTPEHRTWVGSVDKTYMALVAVTLFDDLLAPASQWLPQLDEGITLWHLLTHRTGIFDYMWDGETYEQLAFVPPAPSDPDAFLRAALRGRPRLRPSPRDRLRGRRSDGWLHSSATCNPGR